MRLSRLSQSYITARWLGKLNYLEGLEWQKKAVNKLRLHRSMCTSDGNVPMDVKGHLLLLEMEPVYTVGLRQHFYTIEEENRLKELGADFFRTDRGGLITFHGPGQLVAYPIFDIKSLFVYDDSSKSGRLGIRRFVHLVEEVVIQTVQGFGLTNVDRSTNTGVWMDNGERKIAAIGLSVHSGIINHGLALNCNNDLRWFKEIVPCGLKNKEVTTLTRELGKNVEVSEAIFPLADNFGKVFQCDVKWSSREI